MPSVLLRIPNTQLIWDQTWQWKNIYQNSAAKAQQNYAIKTWKPEISVFFIERLPVAGGTLKKLHIFSRNLLDPQKKHPSMFAT